MGIVNLSHDSTYRSSIAPTVEDAIRRGRVMAAQGADVIDVGAESTTIKADRISGDDQVKQLVPVIEALAADGILVSSESYDVDVVRGCLEAGAAVVPHRLGRRRPGLRARRRARRGRRALPHRGPELARPRGRRPHDRRGAADARRVRPALDRARELGVSGLVVDPGVGFHFGVPQTPEERLQHQTSVVLDSFRFRRLGAPVCLSVPHGFALFQDEFRTGEAFFATLARIGGAGLIRTHEVPRIVPVLRALGELAVSGGRDERREPAPRRTPPGPSASS